MKPAEVPLPKVPMPVAGDGPTAASVEELVALDADRPWRPDRKSVV